MVAFLLEHNVDENIMRNITVRIQVKLEIKVPIKIFLRNAPLKSPTIITTPKRLLTQKFRCPQKILTHVKKIHPCKQF